MLLFALPGTGVSVPKRGSRKAWRSLQAARSDVCLQTYSIYILLFCRKRFELSTRLAGVNYVSVQSTGNKIYEMRTALPDQNVCSFLLKFPKITFKWTKLMGRRLEKWACEQFCNDPSDARSFFTPGFPMRNYLTTFHSFFSNMMKNRVKSLYELDLRCWAISETCASFATQHRDLSVGHEVWEEGNLGRWTFKGHKTELPLSNILRSWRPPPKTQTDRRIVMQNRRLNTAFTVTTHNFDRSWAAPIIVTRCGKRSAAPSSHQVFRHTTR